MAQLCPPSAVELTTQAVALGIQDGFTAHVSGIAVDRDFIYATHTLSSPELPAGATGVGHVVIIDRAAFGDPNVTPVRVPVGFDPRSLALNPNNGTMYVVNRGQPDANGNNGFSLSVVGRAAETGAFAELTQIKLSFGLADVAINPATNRVYVSNWSQRRIHVINGATNTELAPIMDSTGNQDQANSFRPLGMAIDPATNTLYVALSHQVVPRVEALAVITLANDEVQSIHRVPITPMRTQPHDVAFNPVTKRLYVAGLGAAGAAPPSVTVIDAVTLDVIATILTRAGVSAASTSTLAVDPQLNQVYVANAGNIQIIDGATNQISQPVELTRVLQSVVLDRQTGQVYAGDRLTGEIRRITAVIAGSPIGQFHQANPQLGAPVTGPQLTPDKRGTVQRFQNGAVFASADYGAAQVSNTLFEGWQSLIHSVVLTANTSRVELAANTTRADLGNLLKDGIKIGSFDEYAYFERGMIRTSTATGVQQTITVSGPIYQYYNGRGDINSSLREPLAAEENAPNGGRLQHFARGDVYWHPNTGAHEVSGQFMTRIPLVGANAPGASTLPTEVYGVEGNLSLTHSVTGTPGTNYRWAVRTPATAAIITAPGSAVADQITAHESQTPARSVSFALAANATSKQIGMLVEGQPGTERNKQFLLSEMPVLAQQSVQARIDNGGQELLVTNTGPATTFRLQVRPQPGVALTPSKSITLNGGKSARLRPADWSNPASAPLLVEVRDAPNGPAVECFEV